MLKFVPYSTQPHKEIVPVGSPSTGILYFEKRGSLTANESPMDLQEKEKMQAKSQVMILNAAKRLADKIGCTRSEAYQLLLSTPVEKEDGEVSVEYSLFDYLTDEEQQEFLAMQGSVDGIKLSVATLMMRYRVAFPVVVEKEAIAGSSELYVPNLQFPLEKGDRLKFGSTVVEVQEVATVEHRKSSLIKVSDLPASVEEGSVGFLCQKGAAQPLIGMIHMGDWAESDTKELLGFNSGKGNSLVDAIYNFYRNESGEQVEATWEEVELDVEKSFSALDSSSTPHQLTGDESSFDFSTTDARTPA